MWAKERGKADSWVHHQAIYHCRRLKLDPTGPPKEPRRMHLELSTWVTEEGGIYSLVPSLHCCRVAPWVVIHSVFQIAHAPVPQSNEALAQKGRADWYSREEQQDQLHGHATCATTQALCLV